MMANSSTALNKLIIRLNFSKERVHFEKNGHLNGHHVAVTPKLDPIYLQMSYKVITNNHNNKFDYELNIIEYFMLIVVIL